MPDADYQEPQQQHKLRDSAEQKRGRQRRGHEWQPQDGRRRAADDERDADRSWDERRVEDEVAEADKKKPEESQCEHLRAATQPEREVQRLDDAADDDADQGQRTGAASRVAEETAEQ